MSLQIIVILITAIFAFIVGMFDLPKVILMYNSKNQMERIASLIEDFDLSGKDHYLYLADIEARYNCYVEIYNEDDTLIYTSRINDALYEENTTPETNAEILKPRIMRILSHTETTENTFLEARQEYYGTAQYLVYGEFFDDGYSVVLYDSLDVINSTSETIETTILIISVFFILVLIGTIFIYLFSFILPLTKINRITQSMAQLNFSEILPSFRISELRQLSSNINHLSKTLESALGELKFKNARLEKDIEEKQHQEIIRREFISNASHELKTPIAIIQGYAEGIKVGIGDENTVKEYSDIIMHEAEKMNSLVVRMLDVSKLESGFQLIRADFNLKAVFCDLLSRYIPLFEDSDIRFYCELDETFFGNGDVQYLCAVLGNYVSNAISHAENEKLITVSAEDIGDVYRVHVFNTGKNIADDDLGKIWISFYRADKARSRENGRFGLGLSIVTSIQTAHNQPYGVENLVNGVDFWFDIAKANQQ